MTALLPNLLPLAAARRTGERERALARFADKIEVNPTLNRQLVSFQANREVPFYSWFKYKEGFSAPLVHYFLSKLTNRPGTLLDPFAGAGSALFAARELGWNARGIEVLPVGCHAVEARLAAEHVKPEQFEAAVEKCLAASFADHADEATAIRHIPITVGAFPQQAERELNGYLSICRRSFRNVPVRTLLTYAAFCILESISYTRKDGQYLRWDARSNRSRGSKDFDKGEIPSFREAITAKLRQMADDLKGSTLFDSGTAKGFLDMRRGSCLDILPTIDGNSIDLVLTSPPYCNRYDYTRTYALELVYLGCGHREIAQLRQQMLSCTVENRDKVQAIRLAYQQRGQEERWRRVSEAFRGQKALHEVLDLLEGIRISGQLNNANIVKMVRNYFYEMAFVVYELARILRPGGKAVIVNDNVRYAGEEVPADLILSDFAESFGLVTRHIWTLPRGKGNSSQQMGDHGRTELRKCVYVWEKPK